VATNRFAGWLVTRDGTRRFEGPFSLPLGPEWAAVPDGPVTFGAPPKEISLGPADDPGGCLP
jgi:hypothetical protein